MDPTVIASAVRRAAMLVNAPVGRPSDLLAVYWRFRCTQADVLGVITGMIDQAIYAVTCLIRGPQPDLTGRSRRRNCWR